VCSKFDDLPPLVWKPLIDEAVVATRRAPKSANSK